MPRSASSDHASPAPATPGAQPLSDAQKALRIRAEIAAAGERKRARHPWLRHQDTIGLAFQLGGIAGMALCAWAYLAGWAPWKPRAWTRRP